MPTKEEPLPSGGKLDDRPPKVRRRGTAFHEAGHVVAALASGFEFKEVSIVPVVIEGVTRHGGIIGVTIPTARRWSPFTIEEGRRVAIFYMAGPESELMEMGHDVGRQMDELNLHSVVDTGRTKSESAAYVHRATEEARAVLRARWVEVQAVAAALLMHGRLNYEQVVRIAQAAHGSAYR